MHKLRLLGPLFLLACPASFVSAQNAVTVPAAALGAPVVLVAPTLPSAAFYAPAGTAFANGMSAKAGSGDFLSAAQRKLKEELAAARKKVEAPKKAPEPGPSPYSDAEIVDMAKRLAQQYKGSPWSYTEYNSVLYPTLDHLRQQGVPERQIELYKKTCEEFPGRPFNPWSGD